MYKEMYTKLILFLLVALALCNPVFAKNPVVPDVGLNDPHVHIFDNKAYIYATHDKSIKNERFIMEDWWIWSSSDLVNWELESVLDPADTYIGAGFKSAWATDAAYRDGKYYWYFSELNEQTGVVVGDSPVGPWKDPLGKPFLARDLTPTHEYDISVIESQGHHYAVFGVWDYYIALMGDDMLSLAETPRKIIINNPVGPYGDDSTDDKPSVHQRNGIFYLSWGAFYATSSNVYGPYDYKGVILNEESFAPGYDAPTWPHGFKQGRHGSFFEWHKQWYFAYCDISQTGNRYFRDTFISYVHYKDNGDIAPIRVDGIGVGEYDVNQGKIEAEDYFTAENAFKQESPYGGFMVSTGDGANYIGFHNVRELKGKKHITIRVSTPIPSDSEIEVRKGSSTGPGIAKFTIKTDQPNVFSDFTTELSDLEDKENLYFSMKPLAGQSVNLDYFLIH
jgi:arabinoxylan arabinofuranohydrolase